MSSHFIHYSRQSIDEEDIEAVVRVLRSDFLTQGPAIEQFEQGVARVAATPAAIAVSSATAGLHLACIAAGIASGDTVWTSAISFAASANCARYVGAHIDFVDVDTDTGNLCPQELAEKLAKASAAGTLPKALIVVHFSGRTCNMEAIYALKEQYGFSVIEDAAHAFGAFYPTGKPVGSDSRSLAVVFSFHPVKPITTGEGGAITTHDAQFAKKLRMLRTHGITRDPEQLEQANMPAWYYEQQLLGYNYRMTDIQAALGESQSKKIHRFNDARRQLATRYANILDGLPLLLPPADNHSSWHLYVVRLSAGTRLSRDDAFRKLRAENIGVNVHYMPIHLHPYYQRLGFSKGQFPKAEAFFDQALSLPLHQGLVLSDQDFVAQTLRDIL